MTTSRPREWATARHTHRLSSIIDLTCVANEVRRLNLCTREGVSS